VEQYHVAVVGARELVGQELVRILEERNFPFASLDLFSAEGIGEKSVSGIHKAYPVQALSHASEQNTFAKADIVFFVAGDNTSHHWLPGAVQAGATVIDSSSVHRMDPQVPLIIPEINAAEIKEKHHIISSPGCSTIILNSILYPLHKVNLVKKVVVSSYQSTSGMGQAAMDELTLQTQQIMAGESPRPIIFPHEIGFNVLPQVDVFLDNGYTKEEWQLLEETRKILHHNDILVSATCVRVPTFKGHCQSITIEFTNEINSETASDILAETPGVKLVDDTDINLYPHPRMAAGTDLVMVGRIRQDTFNLKGLSLWAVADNIRKGSALNLVQIAEEINKKGWLKPKSQR
jgi:aspartate-semialdehyde dehydrogenase